MGTGRIFLEGPKGIGKTTLLMSCMGELRMTAGGFIVRRLLREDGAVRGFSLTSPGAYDTPSVPFSEGIGNIFIEHTDASSMRRADVLEEGILSLLAGAEERGLIVLDEIGGVELLSHRVRSRLEEVLKSGVPCAGVFKSRENARSMASGLRLPSEYFDRYEEMRALLTRELGATLLTVDSRPGERETEIVGAFMSPLLSPLPEAVG